VSVHAYSAGAVATDYLRTAAGLGLAGVPLAFVETMPWLTVLLAAIALVFAGYGLDTVVRHRTRIEADEAGLRARGIAIRDFDWRAISALRLCYYSTRRDRSRGWLQLTLEGGGRRLRVDSRISGFAELVARASAAAGRNRLRLDAATLSNLAAMGIDEAAPAARAEEVR
jgi:hypothetical protein